MKEFNHHIQSALMSKGMLALFAVIAIGSVLLRWEHGPSERVETAKFRTLDMRK